jgi:site-specific DNA recombinase
MITAIYTRTSTATQDISLSAQKDACLAYVKAKGWGHTIVFEEKESAKTLNRPVFNDILKRIEAGGVKRVMVYKLDRLSRRLKDILYLVDSFRAKHGNRPSVDTVRPDIRLHLFLLDDLATIYLDLSGAAFT